MKKAAKTTPRQKSDVENLSKTMSRLSTGGQKKSEFNMIFVYPEINFVYVENDTDHVQVEFLVQAMNMDHFQPRVSNDGLTLELRTEVPNFFYDSDRLVKSNEDVTTFNKNSHKFTAMEKVLDSCKKHHDWEDYNDKIWSPPQLVVLPFICEEEILEWEVQ